MNKKVLVISSSLRSGGNSETLADVIAFAPPIYYYEMCGQQKTMLDRTNPLYGTDYRFRDIYMLSAAAEDETTAADKAENGLQGWIDCFPKAKLTGTVLASGVNSVGEIANHPALKKTFDLGKAIKSEVYEVKRMYLTLCNILLAASIAACGVAEAPTQANAPSVISPPSITEETDTLAEDVASKQFELTTAQGKTILFSLNDGGAAKSFYEQLPLSLNIEDYGEHEKIFYPPEKLDTSDTPLAKGPIGTLTYYAPWGNVAIYSGDCGGASGLYGLGQVISGSEYISQLSGAVQLEAISGSVSSSVSASPENTDISKAPPSTNVQKPPQNATAISPAPKQPVQTPPESTPEPSVPEDNIMSIIQIMVGNTSFTATLEENEAGRAFAKLLQNAPLSIAMSDYSGFEKVGSLGTSLPESNRQITAQAGDIILYNSNQICVFYGSNSWSYTRLGKVDDLSGWAEALGSGDVTLTFSLN